MARGYVLDEREGEDEMEREGREAAVKLLAAQWNQLNDQLERNAVRDQIDAEEGRDPLDCYEDEILGAGDDAYQAAIDNGDSIQDARRARREAEQAERDRCLYEAEEPFRRMHAQIDALESALDALGARMMRPYEHWNEDERYFEIMENRDW